ncbi:MafI family immunity protein [Comamonas sp. JNW]|uniref:MafI family immunity protein n=1 Tax=Comamonas sp. JNW TaxID=2170731 RepID=UPI000DE6063C|nr:MafI family immunity protein [Comamonas sp. JNW]PWB19089.1 hypothetical protein DCO45_07710 [Comamonas sp. JNW]
MSEDEEICNLADLFSEKLPDFRIETVKDYVSHGENMLALELLCDFFVDHDVNLSESEYQQVVRVGNLLKMDFSGTRFDYLRLRDS